MPPKSSSKAASTWHRCKSCRVVLSQKDAILHQQSNCPPPEQNWVHGFIRQKVIFSWLGEVTADALKTQGLEDAESMLWISAAVLKMCGICVGEAVIVEALGVRTIKTAWPIAEKSISKVYMSKEGLEFASESCNAPVKVRKLPHAFPPASEIIISTLNEETLVSKFTADVLLLLRSIYCGKYLQAGSVLHIPHYGKRLRFLVESVTPVPKAIYYDSRTPSSSFVDAVTESFQQLSFVEGKGGIERFCSTPVQFKQKNSGEEISENSVGHIPMFSGPVDESAAHNATTPSRKNVRKMTDDSYAENTLDETINELSLSSHTLEESNCKFPALESEFYHVTNSSEWKLKSNKIFDENFSTMERITLPEIGGLEEVVKELLEIMKLALNTTYSSNFGLKVAKGVLLFGPPGTGKTMLAHALACESKVSVHSLKGGELFSKLLGETEAKLRAFFSSATSSGPAVIILDEIDSLCPKKSNHTGSTELERRVVSTLSTLLDGLCMRKVFVIATTSRLDFIDPVIRRPGRLDHEVEIPVPSSSARIDILSKLLISVPHSLSENELKSIAQAAHGFVGADLASLVSQAGMQAFESACEDFPVILNEKHMKWALLQVHPSAMREVLVDIPNVRWSDIAGQEELKLKLQQAVEWPLTHPEAFRRLGISPPKGVLMFGPPGCSKTMIAKALATESRLNFLSIKGPELFSKWVGESERAVRELFRKARMVAPAIVFFDEIDALGGERGTSGSGGSNVQERVLAQLLTEMDGVTALENVVIVAATNRPDRIDKALLRPGRLDRIIYVPLPDKNTRKKIFNLQLIKMPVCKEVDIEMLVNETNGYSGAEVLAVCHEAALKALEEDILADIIKKEHFLQALTIVTPRTSSSLLQLYDVYNKR